MTNEGKNQVFEQFGIIGTGRVTGGELLLREMLTEDIEVDEAATLAALIITIVGYVDMYVSGKPDILMCNSRSVFHYFSGTQKLILDKAESRWRIIKKIWKMQKDAAFTEKLKEFIETYSV